MLRWMAFDIEVYLSWIDVFVYSTDEKQLRQAMNRLAQSEAVLGGVLASAGWPKARTNARIPTCLSFPAELQRPRLCQGSVVVIP